MNILIVDNSVIPVQLYGGTQRVIWDLGRELKNLGHNIYYLVKKNSKCPFAKIIEIDPLKRIVDQIPENIDIIHFNSLVEGLDLLKKPYIITIHGNIESTDYRFNKNTVFISKNHASRYNSEAFVYNGLNWDKYSKPNFNSKKDSFHFLGKASWGVKNLKGAIDIIQNTKQESLNVLGGKRFEQRVLKMGPNYIFAKKVSFKGMNGWRY